MDEIGRRAPRAALRALDAEIRASIALAINMGGDAGIAARFAAAQGRARIEADAIMKEVPMFSTGKWFKTSLGAAIAGAVVTVLSLPETGALVQATIESAVSPQYVPFATAFLASIAGAIAGRTSKP